MIQTFNHTIGIHFIEIWIVSIFHIIKWNKKESGTCFFLFFFPDIPFVFHQFYPNFFHKIKIIFFQILCYFKNKKMFYIIFIYFRQFNLNGSFICFETSDFGRQKNMFGKTVNCLFSKTNTLKFLSSHNWEILWLKSKQSKQ